MYINLYIYIYYRRKDARVKLPDDGARIEFLEEGGWMQGVCRDSIQYDCGTVMSTIVHDGDVGDSVLDLSKVRWNVLYACSSCTLFTKGVRKCSTCHTERD